MEQFFVVVRYAICKRCEHAIDFVQHLIEPANSLATHSMRTRETSVLLTPIATHTCVHTINPLFAFEIYQTSLVHQLVAINKHNLCAASSHASDHMLREEVPEIPTGLWNIQNCPAHASHLDQLNPLPLQLVRDRQLLLPTKEDNTCTSSSLLQFTHCSLLTVLATLKDKS